MRFATLLFRVDLEAFGGERRRLELFEKHAYPSRADFAVNGAVPFLFRLRHADQLAVDGHMSAPVVHIRYHAVSVDRPACDGILFHIVKRDER